MVRDLGQEVPLASMQGENEVFAVHSVFGLGFFSLMLQGRNTRFFLVEGRQLELGMSYVLKRIVLSLIEVVLKSLYFFVHGSWSRNEEICGFTRRNNEEITNIIFHFRHALKEVIIRNLFRY
jgi:hypothetical protein